jgi:hypothetical protein
MATVIQDSAPVVMWLTLLILNVAVAIIVMLKYSMNAILLKDVLREKVAATVPAAGAREQVHRIATTPAMAG